PQWSCRGSTTLYREGLYRGGFSRVRSGAAAVRLGSRLRKAAFTAAESLNTRATSASSTTTLAPWLYRCVYLPRAPEVKLYSARIAGSTDPAGLAVVLFLALFDSGLVFILPPFFASG